MTSPVRPSTVIGAVAVVALTEMPAGTGMLKATRGLLLVGRVVGEAGGNVNVKVHWGFVVVGPLVGQRVGAKLNRALVEGVALIHFHFWGARGVTRHPLVSRPATNGNRAGIVDQVDRAAGSDL